MRHQVKLIAFDLDGTVLNSRKEISARTIKAFQNALDAGIRLVPATGRQYSAIPQEVVNVSRSLLIANNGAQVFEMPVKKTIREYCFDAKTAVSLVRELRAFNGMIFAAHGDVGVYDDKGAGFLSGVTKRILDKYGWWNEHPFADVETVTGEKKHILKMVMIFEDLDERKRALDYFTGRPDLYITFFDDNNIELMPAGTNKGGALKFCAGRLGLSLDEVMAIGDSDNDREMLCIAGLSVAMGNASAEIKAAAGQTTKSCEEDGAALAIEAILGSD
ncbi:MAG: Cof-type HAD-IIB family hydrolase [Treponema sp.]|jgi:Cof subfamily protein (haloacid dehalogenase superfamily)|nr:Cof-type HAD-IIB family hydrolase [Treponema sp.]